MRHLEKRHGLSWLEVQSLFEAVKAIQERKTNIVQLKSQVRKRAVEKILSRYNLPYASLNSSTHSLKMEKYSCENFIKIVMPIYSEFQKIIETQKQGRIDLARRILTTRVPDVRAIYQTFTGNSKLEQTQSILDCLKDHKELQQQASEILSTKLTSNSMLIYSAIDWTLKTKPIPLQVKINFSSKQRYHFIPLFAPIAEIISERPAKRNESIIIENIDTAVSSIHNAPLFDLVISAGGNAINGEMACNILTKIAQELPSSLTYFSDFDPEGLKIFKNLSDHLNEFQISIGFHVPKNIDLVEIASLYGTKLNRKSRELFTEQLTTINNKEACVVIEKMLEANSTLEQNTLLYIDDGICKI